jgi:hypothetical protein
MERLPLRQACRQVLVQQWVLLVWELRAAWEEQVSQA